MIDHAPREEEERQKRPEERQIPRDAEESWPAAAKQAHGAWPHRAIDPIVMAAEIVQAFQTIRSRNMDPQAPGVVTVGIINGGQRYNIIPESVELQGTVRAYDVAVQDMVEKRMHEILKGITSAYGGDYEMTYKRHTPATVNDKALTDWAGEQLNAVLGEDNAQHFPPVMGAEDFAYFANEVPGFYYWLGVTPKGETNSALHTPTMRADDAAVPEPVHGTRAKPATSRNGLYRKSAAPSRRASASTSGCR